MREEPSWAEGEECVKTQRSEPVGMLVMTGRPCGWSGTSKGEEQGLTSEGNSEPESQRKIVFHVREWGPWKVLSKGERGPDMFNWTTLADGQSIRVGGSGGGREIHGAALWQSRGERAVAVGPERWQKRWQIAASEAILRVQLMDFLVQ